MALLTKMRAGWFLRLAPLGTQLTGAEQIPKSVRVSRRSSALVALDGDHFRHSDVHVRAPLIGEVGKRPSLAAERDGSLIRFENEIQHDPKAGQAQARRAARRNSARSGPEEQTQAKSPGLH